VAAVPGLFAAPTLNSLAAKGETATGCAISPPFTVTGTRLSFRIHGGLPSRDDQGPTLAVRIGPVDRSAGASFAWIGVSDAVMDCR